MPASRLAGVRPHGSRALAEPRPRHRLDRRFVVEVALAVLIAAVVYVQTERIARQAADQSEAFVGWSANQENIRFVRETVTGGSLVMPFANLDVSGGSFRGLFFGCTDAEREVAQAWSDTLSDPRYTGGNCRADFSAANLDTADFGGAQVYLANFQRAALVGTSFASENVSQANFRYATLDAATFERAFANRATFRDSTLTNTSFKDANLTYASFVHVDLVGVDFTGASLVGATFVDVTCRSVLWPTGFTPPVGC